MIDKNLQVVYVYIIECEDGSLYTGIDIDTSEALKWYTLSANQGYEQAIDFLNKLKSES